MTLNPIRAVRCYRWRKRVAWFTREAERRREWRDSPWNMRRVKPDLIRTELDWAVWLEPMEEKR